MHAIVFLHTLFCSVAESVANTNLYSHAFNPYPVSLMYQTVAFWYRHTPGATLDDIRLVPRHTFRTQNHLAKGAVTCRALYNTWTKDDTRHRCMCLDCLNGPEVHPWERVFEIQSIEEWTRMNLGGWSENVWQRLRLSFRSRLSNLTACHEGKHTAGRIEVKLCHHLVYGQLFQYM